jgi:hypothetical protein
VFLDLPLQLLGNFGRFVPDLPDVAVVLAYKPLGPINAAFQIENFAFVRSKLPT